MGELVRHKFAVFFVALVSYALSCEVGSTTTFATAEVLVQIRELSFTVNDNVTDKCFLSASALKSKTEANLSRSSITVNLEANYYLSYDITGYAIHAGERQVGCIANIEMSLWTVVKNWGILKLIFSARLLSDGGRLDADILEVSESFTNEVVTAILQARMAANSKP